MLDSALHVFKGLKEVIIVISLETSNLLYQTDKAFPADQVKGLGQVDECDLELSSLLQPFLLQLLQGEDHVYC